jgi:DNA-binding transcriptional MocR family regulator
VEKYKVAYVAGPSFYTDHVSGANKLRLCFSQPKVDQIAVGIKRLAQVLQE